MIRLVAIVIGAWLLLAVLALRLLAAGHDRLPAPNPDPAPEDACHCGGDPWPHAKHLSEAADEACALTQPGADADHFDLWERELTP